MASVTAPSSLAPAREERPSSRKLEKMAPALVLVTLVAIALSMLGERSGAPEAAVMSLNIVSYLAGGFFGAKTALESLREREIDVDLLMVLAALGAAVVGEWHEGAILLFLFSLSNVLQDYAIGRSRRAISSLFTLYPQEATVKRGADIIRLKLEEIRIGDIVLIEPGERIPVDGMVVAGVSAVDQSPITGESIPADKSAGGFVYAGTLNKQGILDVRALKPVGETTLARIIKMVEDAQDSKAPTQRFLDRFEQAYAKAIILGILLLILIPPLLGLSDFESNFYRAMVLMTVASPCALVISVPSAFISAIAAAARSGVLFKGGASLEQLARIKVVAIDKTGTLTEGRPQVTDIVVSPPFAERELVQVAASVEARSEHPLAKAIVAYARAAKISPSETEDFLAVPGQGVRARLDGSDIRVGRISQLQENEAMPDSLAQARIRLEASGKTVIGVLRDRTWLGLIGLADQVRQTSPLLVRELNRLGMVTVMLTGDNPLVAESIGEQLGIDEVYAGLLPHEKAEILAGLQQRYGPVAMIGDGINDAPALAVADVGIAMGGAGADVALETSDVVLMGDRIERLTDALRISDRAKRVVWQNIAFSLAVIAILIAGVFILELALPVGVLGHEGSTVIVVLNGLLSLLILPELRRRKMWKLAR
ncbi:MAG: heavy metal translocating P-type ATPase [Chloroflexi bacterium]|nr:heavy metal translocating P-type ATPase [Chloroflexota bacterium]